jgi:hypothetical protein
VDAGIPLITDLQRAQAIIEALRHRTPKQPTSPVLAISTPNIGSAPTSREKENMGALTAT